MSDFERLKQTEETHERESFNNKLNFTEKARSCRMEIAGTLALNPLSTLNLIRDFVVVVVWPAWLDGDQGIGHASERCDGGGVGVCAAVSAAVPRG